MIARDALAPLEATSSSRGAWAANLLGAVRRQPAGSICMVFALLQLACIGAALLWPTHFRYLSAGNVASLLRAVPQLGVTALGVGVLMVAGEYDLSVGANFALSSSGMAMAYNSGLPLVPSLGVALLVGSAIGVGNGLVTLVGRIPSFIATLGSMMFLRGVILFASGTQTIPFQPGDAVQNLLTGSIGPVPAQFLWLLGATVLCWLLLDRHRFGNHAASVGGDRGTAHAMGIKVARVKLTAFATAGLAAAAGGILSTTRVNSVSPIQGQGLELQAIAACVIGGVALQGGSGSALGILLGAALIYTVQDVLLLLRAPGFYLDAFVGLVLVTAAILNRLLRREE